MCTCGVAFPGNNVVRRLQPHAGAEVPRAVSQVRHSVIGFIRLDTIQDLYEAPMSESVCSRRFWSGHLKKVSWPGHVLAGMQHCCPEGCGALLHVYGSWHQSDINNACRSARISSPALCRGLEGSAGSHVGSSHCGRGAP